MDDGGPGQTKGVVKEETWGERTGRRGARPERRVAKEETQGKVDGEARIAAREVWPYRGPRGMDDSRKI